MVDDKELVDRISRFQAQSISFIFSDDDAIKRKISGPIKERIKQAAGEKCPLCPNTMISSSIKRTPLDERESTLDHIVDLGIGGNNSEENLLILCHECNWAKNHAMQRHLTISGMAGGAPGHKPWRAAFRREGSNIAKLLEYVEWSFRIEEPSSDHRFPELHGYFMQDRFGKSEEPKSKIEKTSDKIPRTPTISELDKRLEKLENTMWKRFTRFISRPFSRKPKTTPKKTIEESKTRSSKRKTRRSKPIKSVEKLELDFAPEDFAAGLLSQKKREQPVTFTTLYERLIKENPKFKLQQYGIRPNDYLTEKCPDLLTIIEKPDGSTPPKIHLWITETNTHAKAPSAEGDFRGIVRGIVVRTPHSKITISALGQRFSKIVQEMGFANKSEYFDSIGFAKNKSISNAIEEHFPDGEIAIDGKHVIRNRRD